MTDSLLIRTTVLEQYSLIVFQFFIVILVVISIKISAAELQTNTSTSANQSIRLSHWYIAKDPTPKESLQIPKDSLWPTSNSISMLKNYSKGNWLVRAEIFVKDSISKKIVWGLFPKRFITAYEIYWDGSKIAQNGQIGRL